MMGSQRFILSLSVFAAVLLLTQAVPTDYIGPPQADAILSDSDPTLVDTGILRKKDYHEEEEVTATERFYRVYENGTIEFKTALSNGHIQYQKISNKVVNGRTIQVYEGYISQLYADGRYGTTYYIADENGYRRTRVGQSNTPPVLSRRSINEAELTRYKGTTEEIGTSVEFEDSGAKKDLSNVRVTKEDVAKFF